MKGRNSQSEAEKKGMRASNINPLMKVENIFCVPRELWNVEAYLYFNKQHFPPVSTSHTVSRPHSLYDFNICHPLQMQ